MYKYLQFSSWRKDTTCEVSSMPERLVPSCLEHFWQTWERGGRLYVGSRRPGLGGPVYTCSRCCHAQWTPFLYVVWAVIYQVQDGFRLLEIAVAGVIFLDGESSEACSEVSMAWKELCDLVIQLDPIHTGSVSHIREIFVGGSSPWKTLPSVIPCVHDGISDPGADIYNRFEANHKIRHRATSKRWWLYWKPTYLVSHYYKLLGFSFIYFCHSLA